MTKTKTRSAQRRDIGWPQAAVAIVATVVAAVLSRPLITSPTTHLLATCVWAAVVLVALLAYGRGGRR